MTATFTYGQAVSTVEHALKFGIDPSLEPIKAMCAALGDPQKRYQCVQVAGSNGKSSTTRITAAMLHEAGYKVGLYTSPHLVKYPERIEIDGQPVSDHQFAAGVQAAVEAAESCGLDATEFELLTAAAFWLFAQEGVEWAVLECGLGGRWDATSVVDPRVAVITGVALEHTQVLGDTIEAIAAEKAAIIKPGSTAVFAYGLPAEEVFEARAREVGAPVVRAGQFTARDYASSMRHLPSYQDMNASTALEVVKAALGSMPPEDVLRRALENVVIPGRFEVLREEPLLMIDAAHNPQSAQILAEELERRFITAQAHESVVSVQTAAGRQAVPTLLLGVLADKDVRGVVEALCPLFDRIVVTASSSPRAISAVRLAQIVLEVTGREPEIAETVSAALDLLSEEPVFATGSITIAGEVKRVFQMR